MSTINNKLDSMIDAMIENRIGAAIERYMGGQDSGLPAKAGIFDKLAAYDVRNVEGPAQRVRQMERKPEPSQRTRTPRPSVRYVVNTGKRGAAPKMPHMFDTASRVWDIIRKRKNGITAQEIEDASGPLGSPNRLKKKTVESCVWYLRSEGVIRSERIA